MFGKRVCCMVLIKGGFFCVWKTPLTYGFIVLRLFFTFLFFFSFFLFAFFCILFAADKKFLCRFVSETNRARQIFECCVRGGKARMKPLPALPGEFLSGRVPQNAEKRLNPRQRFVPADVKVNEQSVEKNDAGDGADDEFSCLFGTPGLSDPVDVDGGTENFKFVVIVFAVHVDGDLVVRIEVVELNDNGVVGFDQFGRNVA